MNRVRTTRAGWWFLGTTMLLAFGLRVYRLASQSIWYDEGLSVYYARQPLPELLALVSGSDHPPLYFLLLHVWLRMTAFGQPAVELVVRYPSVIFGVLLVPLVYVLGHHILDERAGLVAALLIAISPFHVWYSQETRMYTLVVFLTLWASYALCVALAGADLGGLHSVSSDQTHWLERFLNQKKNFRETSKVWVWGVYGLTTAAALYAHFYASFVLMAHAAFVTWWAWHRDRWRSWVRWAGTSAVAVLIFLPWGGLVAGQLRANDTYWRGTLDLGRTISETAQAFAVGETMDGRIAALTTVAYLLLVITGLMVGVRSPKRRPELAEGPEVRSLSRSNFARPGSPDPGQRRGSDDPLRANLGLLGLLDRRTLTSDPSTQLRTSFGLRTSDSTVFLLVYVLLPLIALLAISYNRPKFAPRYLLTVTPALALLAGQGAVALGRAGRQPQFLRYATAITLVGVIIAARGLSLWRHYTDETQFKVDWRAAAQYISQHATPRDAIVIVAGHAMPAFDFYKDDTNRLDVYPIPPRLLPTVSDPVESGDVTTTLNRLMQEDHNRVWLILWQERLADPRRLTLNQLFEHGRRLGIGRRFHSLAMLLFKLPPGTVFEPLGPEHGLDLVYDRRLRLEGYDLSTTSIASGDTIILRLYWRAVEPISRDYTAFTQLLSAEDQIVGQHDHRLGGDLYPTSRWPVGEPVRETYELTVEPDTPPGRYRLIAGVYLPPTGPRLPVAGNNAAGDHVVVAEITVGTTN